MTDMQFGRNIQYRMIQPPAGRLESILPGRTGRRIEDLITDLVGPREKLDELV